MSEPNYAERSVTWWEHFIARLLMALDDFGQAFLRGGVIGVSISSRSGTAKAHGHKWGCIVCNTLLAVRPFGVDPVTHKEHCIGAIDSDIMRSLRVPKALLMDSAVYTYIDGDKTPAYKKIITLLQDPDVVQFMKENQGII